MSETGIIEIDVDGLAVAVDEDEYNADPERIIESVRTARQEIVGDLSGIFDEAPDYDTLVDAFGEDEDTEVDDEGE